MPRGIGRMQQGPPVAPASGARGVVGGLQAGGVVRHRYPRQSLLSFAFVISRSTAAPHDEPSPEAHEPAPDTLDPGLLPKCDGLVERVSPVVLVDVRSEEPADVEPSLAA